MAHDEFDTTHLVWFLAGIGIGAVVTLMFAPQAGSETRRMLARGAGKAKALALDGAERGRDYLSERAEELREQGRELYERGREVAEEAAGRSRKLMKG